MKSKTNKKLTMKAVYDELFSIKNNHNYHYENESDAYHHLQDMIIETQRNQFELKGLIKSYFCLIISGVWLIMTYISIIINENLALFWSMICSISFVILALINEKKYRKVLDE